MILLFFCSCLPPAKSRPLSRCEAPSPKRKSTTTTGTDSVATTETEKVDIPAREDDSVVTHLPSPVVQLPFEEKAPSLLESFGVFEGQVENHTLVLAAAENAAESLPSTLPSVAMDFASLESGDIVTLDMAELNEPEILINNEMTTL